MKKLLVLLMAAIMLLGVSACQPSSNTQKSSKTSDASLSAIKEKGEAILGFDEAFPPMGFKDDNGQYTGFDIEVAKAVFAKMGIKLKLQPINWDVKEQELNTGNIDMLWNGFTITDERKQAILFSDPYMNNRQVLVVTKDSPYQTANDLLGKKLGLQAGSSAADALDSEPDFKSKMKVANFDDNMMALLDLQNGGLDCVLMDEIVANYYITKKGENYRVLDKELAREEFGVGFRKADKAFRDAVNDTMIAMAKDGSLAKISTTWFGKDVTTIGK